MLKKASLFLIILLLLIGYLYIKEKGTDHHTFFNMVENNDTAGIRKAIESGFNVNEAYEYNERSETPLIFAVKKTKPDIVRLLLDSQAHVNILDQDKCTPLYYAVEKTVHRSFTNEATETVLDHLLYHKADPNAIIHDHSPLIVFAISGNHFDKALTTTQKLIQSGASLNPPQEAQENHPLIAAFYLGYGEKVTSTQEKEKRRCTMTTLLLESGADPTIIWDDEKTSLHMIANPVLEGDNVEIAQLLLDAGVDPNHKDSRGLTAGDYAKTAGKTRLLNKLENHARQEIK